MRKTKEETYKVTYDEYYCDECGKYIGRYDREYDRLYKIRIISFKIPQFHLKLNKCVCCKECEEKAEANLIAQLKSIGFYEDK